ncbi:hypothetical protein ACQEVZ_20890 [Dactylosporangium sp. CA-152071]|uniref:hypothetical protein n=1 Tax=Dactylosporangium sp. CA-152071 TaxID=3239933 RepID=UPI003D8A01F0
MNANDGVEAPNYALERRWIMRGRRPGNITEPRHGPQPCDLAFGLQLDRKNLPSALA